MNRGDLQTFYPNYAGSGLNELGFFMQGGNESSFDEDPELDDSNDDQESTEYENEVSEVSDVVASENEPPQPGKCGFWDFRNKVKQKKEQLKAQYGKGKLNVLACGIKPARLETPKYNPIIKVPTTYWPGGGCGINPDLRPEYWHVPCLWDCSKSKNTDKDCCKTNRQKDADKLAAFSTFNDCKNREGKVMTQGNEQAYDAATAKWNADMAVWHACTAEHPLWQPGWRREWRKFKKAGGLKQLAGECKVEMSGGSPPVTPTPTPTPLTQSGLSCPALMRQYNIVPGQDWGTAPVEIRREWQERGCKGPSAAKAKTKVGTYTPGMSCSDMMDEFGIVPGQTFGTAPAEAIAEWRKRSCTGTETESEGGRASRPGTTEGTDNKKMIIIGVIAVVAIIAIALVVRAMRSKA